MSKFELYKDKKGETRFRYRAKNGEIMFGSEGYKAKASAVKAIESLKKNVASATIDETALAPKPAAKPAASAKAPAKAAAAKAPVKAAKPAAKPAAKAAKPAAKKAPAKAKATA